MMFSLQKQAFIQKQLSDGENIKLWNGAVQSVGSFQATETTSDSGKQETEIHGEWQKVVPSWIWH